VDTAVRDALQIDVDKVTMTNPEWHAALLTLVGQVAGRLGVSPENARAQLYKVLLYEKGGHFKTHQDTEKETGMFGTLVVQLPSDYTGGSIAVQHAGVERVFDMGAKDSSAMHNFHHVAFYADCKHEIRPVTDGCRLVAVYSLCWNDTGAPPSPPSIETALLLKEPIKKAERCIGWILEHQYTPASLSRYGLLALKGADRVVADAVATAGELIRQEDPSLALAVHLVQAKRDDDCGRRGRDGAGPAQAGPRRRPLLPGRLRAVRGRQAGAARDPVLRRHHQPRDRGPRGGRENGPL